MAATSGDMMLTVNSTDTGVQKSRNYTEQPAFPVDMAFFLTMGNVRYYGQPPIIAMGVLGNILSYLVFSRTRLRKVPSVPYLAGVAVTDTGFMCTYFMMTLTDIYHVPIISQVGVCQFGTFTNFVFLFLSMWYLVALVVEKFICVFWPLRKATFCTVFRAKVVLVSLAVLAIASYSYVIYFFGPDPRTSRCEPWLEFRSQYAKLYMLDAIVVYAVPLLIIIVLLLLIVIKGCEYYRISSAAEFVPRLHNNRTKVSESSVRVTKVLFPVLLLVLLCHVPNSTVLVLLFFHKQLSFHQKSELFKASQVVHFIMIISFAAKLFVYLIFSKSFRQSLMDFLRSSKNRRPLFCRCHSANDVDAQRITMYGYNHQQSPLGMTQSDV